MTKASDITINGYQLTENEARIVNDLIGDALFGFIAPNNLNDNVTSESANKTLQRLVEKI